MTAFYLVLFLFIAFILVILFKAIKFTPYLEKDIAITEVKPNCEKIVPHFTELLKCKTVSSLDEEMIDWNEFSKFKNLLIKLYPNVHKTCSREEIGKTGLLYHWKGKKNSEPVVLMSHYDVVPANEELWSKPAFDGIVEDNVIWGRGTLDTKGTLCSILEAAEYHISQGFVPENDIYFSFSGDEEISGETAPTIVDVLKKRNIKPSLVLDEGGAIVNDIFPGVRESCALIGIGEKGYLDLELSITGKGGHSSSPPPHTLPGILSQAVVNIEKRPFKSHLTPAAREMFDLLGRHSSFGFRVVFANLWCFRPLLDRLFRKKGGELNAMLRTTCAVTKMEGSKAFNVMPPKAAIGLNLRLLANENMENAAEYIKKIIKNDKIIITKINGRDASPYSDTSSKEWQRVKDVIRENWGNVIVSPYLMLAGSDSRHFCDISDNVLRFSAMKLSKEEIGLIHGNDERISVDSFMETVSFYIRLIKKC